MLTKPAKSTQDAAMCLPANITRHIDEANTTYVRALVLDFSSAFNMTNVNLLIDKIQHLDVSIVRWEQSILTKRKSGLNNDSSMITTQTGMPQRTVLSPVLLILYTDSLRSTEKAAAIKYADDSVLLGYLASYPMMQIMCYTLIKFSRSLITVTKATYF